MSSEVRLHEAAANVEALLSGIASGSDNVQLSKDHLLQLLAYLEGELQAKDIALNTLRAERTKSALYQAKYGRLGANDPFLALQRDAVIAEEQLDETAISNMYESQLTQLEKLIAVQRKCQAKSKQALLAAERRHSRVIRELEREKQRSVADAAHGDDLCALLDNERTKLKQQLEYQEKECAKLKKDLSTEAQKLAIEKEKHKKIVLFLINERKQILLKMHELRLKNQNDLSGPPEGGLIDELRKEVLNLRQERDHFSSQMKQMSMENSSLKEVIRTQEEDLTLIRQNILSNTRQHTESLARVDDDCAIIANKGASTSGIPSHFMPKTAHNAASPSKIRLSNSSSFPSSTRSRVSSASALNSRGTLPNPTTRPQPSLITNPNVRAHSSASTMRPCGVQSSLMQPSKASSNPTSPIKKIPTPMTTASLGTRRPQALPVRTMANPAVRQQQYIKEPEIEQLGAVIDSMTAPARSPMVTKRSASLPRHSVDSSPSGLPKSISSTKPTSTGGSATMTRKNGLLKGFGVSRSSAEKTRPNS